MFKQLDDEFEEARKRNMKYTRIGLIIAAISSIAVLGFLGWFAVQILDKF